MEILAARALELLEIKVETSATKMGIWAIKINVGIWAIKMLELLEINVEILAIKMLELLEIKVETSATKMGIWAIKIKVETSATKINVEILATKIKVEILATKMMELLEIMVTTKKMMITMKMKVSKE